jgi:sugar phosphate isomerase/epimerase
MELGCSTILYGGQDLSLALEKIASTGYKAVEVCAIQNMAPHLSLGEDASYYEGVKSQVEDRGLVIDSVGGSGNMGDPDRFLQLLDATAAIGAPFVTTGPGGKSDDEDSYKEVVEKISGLAEEAKSRGIKLSIKPHVKNAVYNTETALRFIQEVDREGVGLNYDPTHIWRTPLEEIPEETMDCLLEYMISARIRDVKTRELNICPVAQQVAGEGDLNLPAIVAKLQTAPNIAYGVLEIVGTKEMPVEEIDEVVKRSYDGFSALMN